MDVDELLGLVWREVKSERTVQRAPATKVLAGGAGAACCHYHFPSSLPFHSYQRRKKYKREKKTKKRKKKQRDIRVFRNMK